jgi:hypothetical protein
MHGRIIEECSVRAYYLAMQKRLTLAVLMAMFAAPCATAAPALRAGDIVSHHSSVGLAEPAISPAAQFESPLLETVESGAIG